MLTFDPQYIQESIDWLSSISEKDGKGTTRLLYSETWSQAQNELKERLEGLGMTCHFDAIGNLFGTIEGTDGTGETVATGSHIDTVVDGGRLDGQLGIISSYLSVEKLLATHGKPKKNLQVISLAEEEGSRFPYAFWGSKNLFGLAKKEDVEDIADPNGVRFVDAMRNAGFDFQESYTPREDIIAFIELHIEQGNYLENEGITIGVVDGIVGQKRYTITLTGESNHAGTTRMRYRKDTVEATARIVSRAIDMAKEAGDPLVLTFGSVVPEPNVVNVVPGKTTFSMDCRHSDREALDAFTERVIAYMREVTGEMDIGLEIDNWMDEDPTAMDSRIVETIEATCKDNGISYEVMTSGAGHDSQIFAKYVPTGMIFVPSIRGISHNPDEDTRIEDITIGVQTMAESLYRLAY